MGISVLGVARDRHVEESTFESLRARLEATVHKRCPPWLRHSADDIVQDAVIKVMKIVRRSQHSELNASYLHRVAYSALIDEIRRVRRKAEVVVPEDDGGSAVIDGSPTPDTNTLSSEAGVAIHECLDRLKRERRLAVTLHLQGHSLKESSDLLGWPAKRTENLIYRGLADLRQCLLSKGVSP